ncbi:hypothetical protein [Sporosarcina thermotolerans]|uniref:hypothetical protein n=1 Tax=Sporosarcina thermotolerans TaxID=633404 RepID=UPI0036D2964F
MKNLFFIIIIGIVLISILIFISSHIVTILAVISFIVLLIGLFSLDSLNKLEVQNHIKLISKSQYKTLLSAYISCMYLTQVYYNDTYSHFTNRAGVSESLLVFLAFAPGAVVMMYVLISASLKWNSFNKSI